METHARRQLKPSVLGLILLTQFALFVGLAQWMTRDLIPHYADLIRYVQVGAAVLNGQRPYLDFPLEYPLGAAGLMALVAWPVWHMPSLEAAVNGALPGMFVGFGLLAAASGLMLQRAFGRVQRWFDSAAVRFAVLTTIVTPLAPFRFDLAPMAATAAALFATARGFYFLAGVAVGVGTILKIYPAVVLLPLPILLAVQKRWRPLLMLLAGQAAVLAVPVLIYLKHGPTASFGFMGYHTGRGLQIESTGAWVAGLLGRVFDWSTEVVLNAASYEVTNPAAPVLLKITKLLLMAGLAATMIYAAWIGRRLREQSNDNAAIVTERLASLTLCVALLFTNVFSTQYVIWLLPFVVTGSRWRFALIAAIAAITMLIYPYDYVSYSHLTPGKIGLLAMRSALLAMLASIDACWLSRGGLGRPATHPLTNRQSDKR